MPSGSHMRRAVVLWAACGAFFFVTAVGAESPDNSPLRLDWRVRTPS